MTKKELEAEVERLGREVRSLQSQLNSMVRPQPAPIYVYPPPRGDQTSSPPPWPGAFWNVWYG